MKTNGINPPRSIFIIIGILVTATIISLLFADKPVFNFLRQKPFSFHDNIFEIAFEQLGKVYAVVWLFLFWVWITGKHKTVLIGLLALLITIPAILPVKAAVRRTRPSEVIKLETQNKNNYVSYKNYSFPSGDTASVFAVGTVLAVSATWPVIIGIAISCGAVGFLRVLDFAHYPSDVLAGAAIGIFCGLAALRIIGKHKKLENILAGKEQALSLVGIFAIPLLSWLFQGPAKFDILLIFYTPAAAAIYLYGWSQKIKGKIQNPYIEQMRRQGTWFVRWRGYLLLMLAPFFLIELRYFTYPENSHLLDVLWELFCLGISFAGVAMRIHTIRYSLPESNDDKDSKSKEVKMNTEGMYSIVRYPLYLSNFIILMGIVLLARSAALVIFCFLALMIYYERAIVDREALLFEKYGQFFTDWAMKTPMIIPKFKLWKSPEQHLSWQVVLKREYSVFFVIILAFTAIEIIGDRIYTGTWQFDPLWMILFCAGLCVFVILRTLKKLGIIKRN